MAPPIAIAATDFSAALDAALGPYSADGWHVDGPSDSPWIVVRAVGATIPGQGWKLHVTSGVRSAMTTLECCLSLLLRHRASFKFARDDEVLQRLNSGSAGSAQVGKFLTVYPLDDHAAIRLAVELDALTRDLRGPAVPSDRRLRPGSSVSYRYGAFHGALVVQTPLGEIRPGLYDGSGRVVPDSRTLRYVAPSWLPDPFEAAGLGAPLAETPEDGRFTPVWELHRSSAGTIHVGVDMELLQRCVLKTARRGALIGEDGRDAADRLEREADVLRLTSGIAGCPEFVGMTANTDHATLAVADRSGIPLDHHLSTLRNAGTPPTAHDIVRWGLELTATLTAMHDIELVHRDLKPGNIIVTPDGHVELIDLNSACALSPDDGRLSHLGAGGTPGYMSPQQAAATAPSISDDVYGLGGVLYFLLSGAQPAQTPFHQHPARARPLALLTPEASPALVEIVERCVAIEPQRRFASMPELAASLRAAAPRVSTAHAEDRGGVPESTTPGRHRFLEAARQAACTLAATAERAPHSRAVWTTAHPTGRGSFSRDLAMGTAGAVLATAEFTEAFPALALHDTLRDAAHRLVEAPVPDNRLPGLYVGDAGVATALLRCAQVLGDAVFLDHAEQLSRQVAETPFGSPDLYHGTAGRLRFHLALHAVSGERGELDHARAAADHLAHTVERSSDGEAYWRIPDGYADLSGTAMLGYAHGAAGIADALCDLLVVDDHAHAPLRELVTGTGRWISNHALELPPTDPSGDAALMWPVQPGLRPAGPFWCHGAVGIGGFLHRLADLDLLTGARDMAHAAGCAADTVGRSVGPTLCHGLAGSLDLLVDEYQWSRDPTVLQRADALGDLLMAFALRRGGNQVWCSDDPNLVTPDLLIGYSGIGLSLLRLAQAPTRARPLTLQAFDRRPSSPLSGLGR